jgi:hypothetical protein
MNNVFKLHAMPLAMVSDRDRVFTSHIWQELIKLAGTNLKMSRAYHPQTDGQTERVNQRLETYLRCFVHACPNKWSSWLALAEYWYNTSFHSSLGKSPFQVLYGHEPRHFGIDISQSCQNEDLNNWLQDREVMQQLVKQHLIRAHNKMKSQADKHRSPREFQIGESVYLKAQPYVQTSLAPRSSNKLSFKYFGPFPILDQIGTAAYRLKLPDHCLIHHVFHVSQLKKSVTPMTTVSPELPDTSNTFQVPMAILDHRLRQDSDTMISQVLVRWSSLLEELSTWEDETPLRQQFPRASAWGQAGSKGGGSVTGYTSASTPVTDVADGTDGDQAIVGLESEEGGLTEDVSKTGSKVQDREVRNKKPNTRVSGPDWVK